MAALEPPITVPALFTFFLRAAVISRVGRDRAVGLFSSWSRDSWPGRWMKTAHMGDVELRPNWNFQDRHIAGILRALHADLEDGSPAGPLYGQSLSVALAHYLIRRFAVRTTPDREYRNGMPAVRLNRVLDFMRQNCGQETRLWELANLAGMSPHYFCQLFKKSTGVSPYQYSLRCRMDQAKEFLRSPQLTVRQVAEATGFADQSHFTKVFRRMVGVTPVQFRA